MCFVVNLNDISVLIEEGGGIFVSGSDGLMDQFAVGIIEHRGIRLDIGVVILNSRICLLINAHTNCSSIYKFKHPFPSCTNGVI